MAAWPDLPSGVPNGRTVRDLLDYVVWIAERAEAKGFHAGVDLEPWRQRVQRAFGSLVDSMTAGHGDPLPPDVPPSLAPGVWPDIAATSIPGMTVRHQLTVLRSIADQSRRHAGEFHQPADVERWTARVRAAYEALDHGTGFSIPDDARSKAPAPPPKAKGARGKGGAKKPKPRPKAPPRKRVAKKRR